MQFEFFGLSDVGRARDENEDSYLCNEKERLFLIADGMGGHVSGALASQLAVKSVEEFVIQARSVDRTWPIEYRRDLTPEQNLLLAAANLANRRIHRLAAQNPLMEGMGTTLLGVTVEEDHLAVVNVGDCRLYLVRCGTIRQISKDHSLVGKKEREGKLSKDEARKHPQRHILTSALGVQKSPRIDVFLTEITKDDFYLMCSDGLYDMLDDHGILEVINCDRDKSLYRAGLSLVLKANLSGGLDNITVILISF